MDTTSVDAPTDRRATTVADARVAGRAFPAGHGQPEIAPEVAETVLLLVSDGPHVATGRWRPGLPLPRSRASFKGAARRPGPTGR